MKIVESELKGMSKAKDDAVSYVKREKKIFQLQNVFNQVIVASVKAELKKLKQKLGDL
jgi:chromosome segregation ATPase